MSDIKNFYKDVLFGFAVGDALRVPVEFMSRTELQHNPVTDMRGYGVWNQPPGNVQNLKSSLMNCVKVTAILPRDWPERLKSTVEIEVEAEVEVERRMN